MLRNKVFVYRIFTQALLTVLLLCPKLFADQKASLDSFEKLQGIAKQYAHLSGKSIGTISIKVNEIFHTSEDSILYKTANQLKVATKDEVIRRELLFKEGDPFDSFRLQESLRYVRSLRFLRDVTVKAIDKGTHVDIEVFARDTWTVIPQMNYSNGTGNRTNQAGNQACGHNPRRTRRPR